MLITHDTECALSILVELLNTAPEACGSERLPDVAALSAFVVRQEISEIDSLGPADLAAVHELRARLGEVFSAGSVERAAELVNTLVAEAGTTPRLTNHDHHGWHIHYFAPHAAIGRHLAAELGMALAFIVMAGELERLRRCEAPSCARVFVDLSRNRSRRYCDSRTCGNRLHVAAYRARQRSAEAVAEAGPAAGAVSAAGR
ncbi:putative stress-induced transcription regulator [Kitasatospora sp. SolWspMP-SS2h]|uniref:CGNR zinc finger domain-containing protein n=1 Tax=Kitasatospora sp. SolWspMP-SS2h TaxID=1305729 RepID=UPI000DB9E21B|nr:CGNR zinc finger domain-containing protein [Kitasatospora sp. SolWspMP-SS2h]RAJ29186.1 putative stress-induced transcription regulator [Kitasatospora sp. SolWspMP-SS2h]